MDLNFHAKPILKRRSLIILTKVISWVCPTSNDTRKFKVYNYISWVIKKITHDDSYNNNKKMGFLHANQQLR